MNFVFLMDPLHTVKIAKDTTFALMLGAQRRGQRVYFLPQGGLSLRDGKLAFHVTQVTPQDNRTDPFVVHQSLVLQQEQVDTVFVRTDPPFDEKYLMHTWLLDLLPDSIPVINSAAGIRAANEKIWATQFTSIVPRTLITRRQRELLEFVHAETEVIAKPTDGHGGYAVFYLHKDDKNCTVILETLSENWTRDIVLQQFVPETDAGDKRIILLDGEILGAVLRIHSETDHRNNFFAGGKPVATEITARDREIVETIKPELQRHGLYFTGIDIIGDYLIEVNVTSPTGVQEINRLYDVQLEDQVIEFAEQLIEKRKSGMN